MEVPIKQEKLTLSVPEAAKALGVSTSKMYKIVRIEGFPAIRIGKRILVSAKQLPIWVDHLATKGWDAHDPG